MNVQDYTCAGEKNLKSYMKNMSKKEEVGKLLKLNGYGLRL
jgi:hypothetical protein